MSPPLAPRRVADDVFEGFAEDIVAGLDSVSIRFDPIVLETVTKELQTVKVPADDSLQASNIVEIGIEYGGEAGTDLEQVCVHTGLSIADFIALHTKAIHTVEMIGFTPGFSYISGLPEGFDVPRLSHPRPRVPAGAVGISAAFTGIYALPGPGGWPLIGRTSEVLFDPIKDEPFLLKPGQRVRFRAA